MYVDLWSLLGNDSVVEEITIKTVGITDSDDYGNMINSGNTEIKVKVAIVEKLTKSLDVSTGNYLPRKVYHFYIPSEIVFNNVLDGGTIVRQNKKEYIVVSDPIIRGYTSHCVVEATEKRYV